MLCISIFGIPCTILAHVLCNHYRSRNASLQQALTLGADMVMHSATKYMNGHTDVVMGLVATNNEQVHEKLRFLQNGQLREGIQSRS